MSAITSGEDSDDNGPLLHTNNDTGDIIKWKSARCLNIKQWHYNKAKRIYWECIQHRRKLVNCDKSIQAYLRITKCLNCQNTK